MATKKILYFDMDGTLVDFKSGLRKLGHPEDDDFPGDEIEGVFDVMEPMPGAIEAVHELRKRFDTFILSTSPWSNPTALPGKLAWLKRHFGEGETNPFYKQVVFSHRKDLNIGDFLIDDRPDKRGADRFVGELLHFGGPDFPDWPSVVAYLKKRA
jgi:5'(3')-deoxyribonucleotidase